jgi:hypothetical protein
MENSAYFAKLVFALDADGLYRTGVLTLKHWEGGGGGRR